MSDLLASLQEAFGTSSLYEVLGADKKHDDAEIKKAYYKASLKYHPDRSLDGQKEEATRKFQLLSLVYGVLSDSDKRALYDEVGLIDNQGTLLASADGDWCTYWRSMFSMTLEDIIEYEKKYKNSPEEKEDLIKAYNDGEGDMDYIIDHVPCCTLDDEDRFRTMILNMIKSKEIPEYESFVKETEKKRAKRKAMYEAEAKEAQELSKKMKVNVGTKQELELALRNRSAQREVDSERFFKSLEDKYSKKKGGATGGLSKAGKSRKK